VLQVPFALLQLRSRPARFDRLQHATVGVADDPLWLTGQGAEEGAPVGGMRACERLCEPEPRLAGAEADAAEDIEGDPAGRDPPAAGVQGSHPEGQMVKQQRALYRPRRWTMRFEDDRREQLHPVGDELAMMGLAQLAGPTIETQAPGTITSDARGAHVGVAGAHCLERLRDSLGDELVVARRFRALTPPQCSFTVLAAGMP